MFCNTGYPPAPPDLPTPRDRAKSHPHSSRSPRDSRRKNGRRSQTRGERRLFKVALPETASNHYIFCWLSGRALGSGQTERQSPFSALSSSETACDTNGHVRTVMRHFINLCKYLMYHAACKVEFQPFTW